MPLLKQILVAYDSSEQANAALDVALELTFTTNALITACYAVNLATEIGRIASGFHYAPASAEKTLRQDALAILAQASMRASTVGRKIKTQFLDAPVISGINAFAQRTRANMIVIGSHGRSGIPRFVLGSVAEGIMRHAEVPVLVVRTPSRVASRRTPAKSVARRTR
jgi:nucleotide-binding universal stress UspA family protein